MGDILLYRIPGKNAERKFGCFETVKSFNQVKGFIVCDFYKSKRFKFIEKQKSGGLDDNFHFSSQDQTSMVYSKEEYLSLGKAFLQSIRTEDLGKAVFSRIKKESISVDPYTIFEGLCLAHPNAFVYLMSSPFFGTWVGATPETLLKGENNKYTTMSLAGTISKSSNIWTEKEYREQQMVTDFISDKLNSQEINFTKNGPETISAGPVKHLLTEFSFVRRGNDIFNLIEDLHPTPAVSGLPVNEALELISNVEMHDRELYAGFLGVIDDDSCCIFVNLRCAKIIGSDIYLYLGGGYTQDSEIEKEWEETEHKAQTILKVISSNIES